MGYNRNREALANSQRPPTVEITALFALEELREGGYFFLFLRYVRIEQVAEMILQIMPITCANRFIRLNRFPMCTTSLRLYTERGHQEMSFALSVVSECPLSEGADCRQLREIGRFPYSLADALSLVCPYIITPFDCVCQAAFFITC